MNFNFEISVPVLTVLIQGLLSFFSPCVFPLVPLYISYFAGGARETDDQGNIHYPRKRVLLNTVFFVLGISGTFFVLGFGFTALGQFFSDNRLWFARVSGFIMIFFGLYQLGVFGRSDSLEKERRLPMRIDKLAMGPWAAFLLGFTFSFAWTPCVGPTLSSVLLLASSTGNAARGFELIGVYTIGFVLPFLAVGMFTRTVLEFFRKYRNVVQYTVKIGALLLVFLGIMTLTGFMNGLTSYLSGFDGLFQEQIGYENEQVEQENLEVTDADIKEEAVGEEESEPEKPLAPDLILDDQNGNSHTLSDYQGKTVFLNFWATWCPPCRGEMPEIQELYEEFGYNEEDLIVLGIAAPNLGQEGDADAIAKFLSDNGYTFPVVMDDTGLYTYLYGIRAYPTTFMISADGSVYGYVEGALTGDLMRSIIEQTMNYSIFPSR